MVRIKYKWISSFLISYILILSLNSGFVAAADNSMNTQPINTANTWNATLVGNGFTLGYFINPKVTPISEIDFNTLKKVGITDIYVLVSDDNYLSVLSEAKSKADAVGIRTNAWVFPGFSYASQVANMKIGVLLDVETYDMPSYIPQIQAMRLATQGVTFSVCIKPEGWDDEQYLYLLAPLCDHIVPMLYIGDYQQDVSGLTSWVKIYSIYNTIYPGKIIAGLETYESDQNITPKRENTILAEIKAVQPYTGGVILFRYGLSNFNGLNQ
ncbi:MAG: hypothetical protein LLF83_04415 [Methanobacterium sp.]|nr:hypothetical protein [Methanobacterium sp.]